MPSYIETFDDPGVRDLFEPMVPGRPLGPLIALRERIPWPLAGPPFPFDDLRTLSGVFIGSDPALNHVPRPVTTAVEPCGERVDPHAVCTGKDGVPALDALSAWLMLELPPDKSGKAQHVVPTFAWPTRLLSVLAWLVRESDTYRLRGERVPPDVAFVRHCVRVGVVPGGNLDALLQLSLRVVRDAAGPLHDALTEAGLLRPTADVWKLREYPSLVADAITGLSPVPGAPLDGWSVRREIHKGASARRLYSWGWAGPSKCADELVSLADELLAAADPMAKPKRSSFEFGRPHRTRSGSEQVAEWMETYLLVCARWLRFVTVAARVLLHHVYRVTLVYQGLSTLRYGQLFRPGWADALPKLAQLPVDAFAGFAAALAERAQVPPVWPWKFERELEFQVCVSPSSPVAGVRRSGGTLDGDVPARVRAVAASRDARCEGASAPRVPRAVGLSRASEPALQRGVPHGLGERSYDARAVARRRLRRFRVGARRPRAVAS